MARLERLPYSPLSNGVSDAQHPQSIPSLYAGSTAADLLAKELPPVSWAIPGILPEGLTLLGGKPKMGKSWLALGIGVAIATGGVVLGTVRVEAGDVLYLALEDNERRMQDRLRTLLGVDKYSRTPPGLERLHPRYLAPRLDETPGLITILGGWLQEHPETRLVIIDTLARIRPRRRNGGNAYEQDYQDLAPLQDLANQYHVAILVVTHLRKQAADDPLDTLSGTLGLSGGADATLVLTRDRGRADAVLTGSGRDIPEISLALKWDPEIASWSVMGNAEDYRVSQERQEIMDLMRQIGKPVQPKDLYPLLPEKRPDAIRVLMSKMAKAGDLSAGVSGKYVVRGDRQ
jgi:hypothetical protein